MSVADSDQIQDHAGSAGVERLSTGLFTAGVAHEINNPATALMANLYVIRDYAGRFQQLARTYRSLLSQSGDAQLQRLAAQRESELDIAEVEQEINDAILESFECLERIRQLVRSLKFFGGNDVEAVESVDLGEVASSALDVMRQEIQTRAELQTNLASVPPIAAIRTEIGQVVVILLTNGFQALALARCPNPFLQISCRSEGGLVFLEVADNGSGMNREELDHCFDPKRVLAGRGSGLSLAIARELAIRNGGELRVDSQPGQGTRFTLCLPQHSAGAATSPVTHYEAAAVKAAVTLPKRPRLLLVDDERNVLQSLQRLLHENYEISTAESADEALEYIRANKVFDLILSDLVMPQKTGMHLFQESVKLRPELENRFVFFSGGALFGELAEFARVHKARLFDKPANPHSLQEFLNGVLQQLA
jgi:CheY-like chemotaxis protein